MIRHATLSVRFYSSCLHLKMMPHRITTARTTKRNIATPARTPANWIATVAETFACAETMALTPVPTADDYDLR